MNSCTVDQLKKYIKDHGFSAPNQTLKAGLAEFAQILHDATDEELKVWRQSETNSKYDVTVTPVYLREEYALPAEDPECISRRLEHLFEYGWTVMPAVPEFDADGTFRQMLEWFARGNPELDPEKWEEWSNSELAARLHGIVKHRGGHETWMWEIRKLYKKYFEALWFPDGEVKDLLCSFDGWNFMLPTPKKFPKSKVTVGQSRGWMHCDSKRFIDYFQCVQGLVCVTPSGPRDNGLIVIEKSQDFFSEYMRQRPLHGWDWAFIDGDVIVPAEHATEMSRGAITTECLLKELPHLKICAEPGEMVMWDSRVMHQASEMPEARIRAVAYVSMMPSESCSEKDRQRRIQYFEANRMTNHWCYDVFTGERQVACMYQNPDYPVHGGSKNFPPNHGLPDGVATDPEIRKMVGYLD